MRTNVIERLRSMYLRMGLEEPTDLESWRTWFTDVMALFGIVALPLSMLFTFPVFIAEGQYWLVALDVVVWLLFIVRVFAKEKSYAFRAYFWLAVLYWMTITFYVALGPHYARSAWLVGCTVTAVLLFGARAAVVSTAINAAMLISLYWLIGPTNPAWASTLAAPWSKWAMFVVNVSVVTLVTSLPVGLLLSWLGRALDRERETRHGLAVESARLEGALESLPGVFYVLDGKRLVRWNRQLEEVLGCSAEELAGMHGPDLFAEEEKEDIVQAMERALAEGHAEGEAHLATRTGARIPHYFVGSRVMVDGKPHLVGMAIDITDRVQAEKALRESESKYRNLVENAPLGIISIDLQGRITSVNRMLLDILGSPSAEATRAINVLTFAPLIEAGIAQEFRRCMALGEPGISEHFYTTKWGKSAHLRLYLAPFRDAAGSIAGVQGVVEDITEQVEAGKALRESEERLNLALQGAGLGLWDLDMRTGHIVINRHWAEMLGYELEELVPHIDSWQALTHPDDLPRVREAVNEHVQHQTPFYQIEYRILSKSGDWEWLSARGKVVEWNEDGEPLRMAGTHLVITERRRAEEELQRYHDHLEELVEERTGELRRAVNLMAGREVRMAELKDVIQQLRTQLQNAGLSPVADDPQGARGDRQG